jgi:O-antigen ligase
MIRYSLLSLMFVGLAAYAWRDWVRALCLFLIMLAVLERPDMPKGMLGITGMNPFNGLLAVIMLACLVWMVRHRVRYDIPRHVTILVLGYFAIMFVAFARMITDAQIMLDPALPDNLRKNIPDLIVDELINTTKWPIAGLLMLYGCRTRERVRFAVLALLGLYLLLALQVIRNMPLEYALDGQALQERALRVLDRRIGYHRVDLAMMLAGAPWGFVAARYLMTSRLAGVGMVVLSGVTLLGLALTGGRTGYMTWAAVGAVLCVLRWRSLLLLAPVGLAIVVTFLPGTRDRLLQGFDLAALTAPPGATAYGEAVDTDSVTSGRTKVWPYVLRKIAEAPLTGFGREAHHRTQVMYVVYEEEGEVFGHPHNAYLEFALDNGIPALLFVLSFYLLVIYRATVMFRDPSDHLAVAVGGLGISLVLGFLIACVGAQTFYPIQSTVPMWCVIGLTLRVWEIRRQEAAAGVTTPALSTPTPVPALRLSPSEGGAMALWPDRPGALKQARRSR